MDNRSCRDCARLLFQNLRNEASSREDRQRLGGGPASNRRHLNFARGHRDVDAGADFDLLASRDILREDVASWLVRVLLYGHA